MKIQIEISKEEFAAAMKQGEVVTTAKAAEIEDAWDEETEEEESAEPRRKRGRPRKEEAAPAAKKRQTKSAPQVIEENFVEEEYLGGEEEEDEGEEAEENFEDEAEEVAQVFVAGEALKKLQAALAASKKTRGMNETVKILHRFGPASDRVPAEKLKALLKALKG